MNLRMLLPAVLLFAASACGGGGGSQGDSSVSFDSPADGDTVSAPVQVEMSGEGFEVAPADSGGQGTGHFHVMVDAPCVADGETVPKDDQHMHFGDGSTGAEIDLEAGEHTLCLQAGNSAHSAFGSTQEITVTVE